MSHSCTRSLSGRSLRTLLICTPWVGALFGFTASVRADRLPINVKLNGGTAWTCTSGSSTDCDSTNGGYVQVQPGAMITAAFKVTTNGTGTNDDWFGTSWTVVNGSSSGCHDFEPDHTEDGTFTETWTFAAPSAEGIYDLDLTARRNDTCSQGSCGCITLKRAIIVKKVPNPELPDACGFDMVLVIDSSGSIDNTELAQMKDAFEAFVAAFLPETSTKIAVVDFDTSAAVIQGFTSSEASLNNAVNNPTSGGNTNWDDALRDARLLFPNRADKPDVIVFASDGNPNRRGGHTTLGHSSSVASVSEADALAWAVAEADAAKTAGIRIITLGIGTDLDPQSLSLISSPDALITSNFDDLAEDLADLAMNLCGGTITVHKIIDEDGDHTTTGDQTNGAGWEFHANPDAPDFATPSSGVTDANGFINFAIDLGADNDAVVDIVEVPEPNYALIHAVCTVNGNPVGMSGSNAVNKIKIGPLDVVSCTFYNSLNAGACCDLLKEDCSEGVTFKDCDATGDVYGGDGSTCANINPPCSCDDQCSACMQKDGQGSASVDVGLVSAVFNGTNTVFTYKVCENSGSQDLSHWVLGLSESCCHRIVSSSGGSHPITSCGIDPITKLFGLKYETNGGVANCNGATCGQGGTTFTVTLAGNVGSTGCVKTSNKVATKVFYGCIQGPDCFACTNNSQCNDNVACTNDTCNTTTGLCSNTPNNAKCTDNMFCNGVETCNATTGCHDGPDPCAPPLLCNEGIDQCVNCITNAHCDNGQFCDGVETCVNSVCVAGTNPCPADSVSCTNDSCDEVANACLHVPNHSLCSDGEICTNDSCDPVAGCVYVNNNNLCNDNNPCTEFDRCQGGDCMGDPKDCSAYTDQCNVGACNMATGLCFSQPTNEGAACEDGQYCTVGKTCVAGACTGAQPRNCSDNIVCTVDECDEAANVCVHTASDALCTDNAYCNGVETCDPDFGCVAGTPPCVDTVACTIDECIEATDSCVFTPDDGACQDTVFCNGAEICDPEDGCQPGPNPCPDDNVACTQDSCDEVHDACLHQPLNSACANGLYCDGNEICDPILGCQDAANPCPIKCDEANAFPI